MTLEEKDTLFRMITEYSRLSRKVGRAFEAEVSKRTPEAIDEVFRATEEAEDHWRLLVQFIYKLS
jgi:hypothetical protein